MFVRVAELTVSARREAAAAPASPSVQQSYRLQDTPSSSSSRLLPGLIISRVYRPAGPIPWLRV